MRVSLIGRCVVRSMLALLPIASTAARAQEGPRLREAFLIAASDSIREGQYPWAEATLRTLLAQNPADWDVIALLAVSVAGSGDVIRARKIAASLDTRRGASPRMVSIVESALVRYESASRLRSAFNAGVQSGNVGTIEGAIAKDELGSEQSALARGALCVLTGDRRCLRDATAHLPSEGATGELLARLHRQLDDAELHARAYGLALRSFAGAPSTLPSDDSLVTAERVAHAGCPKPRAAWSEAGALKMMTPILECRRKLLARMVQSGRRVVESAPLSRTALEAALSTSLLSETQASVDSASARMRRAIGAIEWPLWELRKHEQKAAFDRALIATPHVLRVTDQAVELLETAFADSLVPLGTRAAGAPTERGVAALPATPGLSLWRVEADDLRGEKQSLRQPINWDVAGVADQLELNQFGSALELRTPLARRVPYPVGVFHFSNAFGDAPTRAVLRSFAGSVSAELGLTASQVELVDSVRTTSKFGTVFNTLAVVSATVTGDVSTAAKATRSLERASAITAASEQDRDAWMKATRENSALQQALSFSVGQAWVADLLSTLMPLSARAR